MIKKKSAQGSRINRLCTVQTSKQKQKSRINEDKPTTAVREINPRLIKHFEEQWEEPESCSAAVQKCMLVIAQLRSHDPLLVQKATGYPLDFARIVVWFLLGNECWIGWGGYVGLLCSLEEYPKNADVLDECQQICDKISTDPSRLIVDREWRKHDRVAIITDFASKL